MKRAGRILTITSVGLLVLGLLVFPVRVQAQIWWPAPDIECEDGITVPEDGTVFGPEAEVTCTVADASDQDSTINPPYLVDDTFNKEDAYTWSSGGVGSFQGGDNTGQTVIWLAPDAAADVTLTVTIDDDAGGEPPVPGRDDDAIQKQVGIKVAKVTLSDPGCVRLNNDDDDESETMDKDETPPITDEDDLEALGVSLGPGSLEDGQLKLEATSGGDKITVWTHNKWAAYATPVGLPKTWNVGEDQLPTDPLWLEGVAASSAVDDVELKLSYTLGEQTLSQQTVNLTVWDLEIGKCPSAWLPSYDSNDLKVTATIKPAGGEGIIHFTVVGSIQNGYCMNATTEDTGPNDSDLKVLQAENNGLTVEEHWPKPTWYTAWTNEEKNSAELTVHCYDYGAFGHIQAHTTINEKLKKAHVPDPEAEVLKFLARIPLDENINCIWDFAEQDHGSTVLNGAIDDTTTTINVDSTQEEGAPKGGSRGLMRIRIDDEQITYTSIDGTTFLNCTRGAYGTTAAAHDDMAVVQWWGASDDSEAYPSGDYTYGDGLSRHEEYRGFLERGEHKRTNANTQKDYFATDGSGFGDLGSFPGSGMPTWHRVEVGEREILSRCINFKHAHGPAHIRDVFSCELIDLDVPNPAYGQCFGPIWATRWCFVKIDTLEIQEAIDDPQRNPEGHTYDELEDWVIGHELGHSVLWHQDGHGHHSGQTTQDCLIWEWGEPWRVNYPSEFCTNNPGCQTRWKLQP